MQAQTISTPRLMAAPLMSQVSAIQEAPALKLTKPAKMGIPGKRLLVLALCLLLAGPAVSECLQQRSGQTRAGKTQAAETESKHALEFLGSYSAPNAISTTDTGHVSAHPPSPPPGRRLLRIETGPTLLPPWRDDLAWTRAEISAACGDTTASDPRVRSKVEAARSDGESPPGGLTGYSRQPAPMSDNAESKSANCPRLSWNQAVARAYARRPGALDGLAAALPGAPSPAAGHLALFLARLSAGDIAATETDFDRVIAAGVRQRDDLWARAIRAWASGELAEAREALT